MYSLKILRDGEVRGLLVVVAYRDNDQASPEYLSQVGVTSLLRLHLTRPDSVEATVHQ